LLRINRHSEFAGLPYAAQQQKIRNAAAIFAEQNVRIDAWIAPGHNFDANTLLALQEANIRVVSDGFYCRPVLRLDAIWIPQQIWRFRKMPAGTWTVCYHPNQFSERDLQRLELDIEKFRDSIVDLRQIVGQGHASPPNFLDRAFSTLWRAALLAKKRLRARGTT
jgi:predicted deacetylase